MKNSLLILACFVVGVLLGYLNILPQQIIEGNYSRYVLLCLMFLVGFAITIDGRIKETIKKFDLNLLVAPLVCIVGTYVGCIVVSLFLSNLSVIDALTIGSGFAYYSLSSILIAETGQDRLAVLALLANIFREVLTLLFAPLMLKYFGRLAPIASAGATSMDTSLPIIIQTSGKEFVFIAIINGIILEICVPIFVTFFLNLG
ncbi:MAG: lysine exporter LysO family protein [Bacteroidales bacterium]